MKTKKILSVLLVLLMTLSLGVCAFADDDNWTSIPTSPNGLNEGEYYLDFTDFLTKSVIEQQGNSFDPAMLAAEIAIYNSGTYYIDYDHCKMKGSFVVPGQYTDSGNPETQEIPAEGGGAWLPYVLYEVGAVWYPVAKSTYNLWDGDYFIDLSTGANEIVSFLSNENLTLYINPGSAWMEYKLVYGGQVMYYPLFSEIGFYFQQCPIKQFSDPYTWTSIPTSPDGLAEGDYYLDFSYDWEAWSPDVRQNRLDMFNGGTWFVDYQNKMLRGSFTVPASMSETGVAYVRSIAPNTEMYLQTIMRVGNWVKIPTSPDGLSNGDFYMDVAALAAVLGMNEADLDGADYYGDAISGDIYLAYEGIGREYFGDDASIRACMIEITAETPAGPETPETPEEPGAPSQTESPIQRIVKAVTSFFLRVVDFFKKMFVK